MKDRTRDGRRLGTPPARRSPGAGAAGGQVVIYGWHSALAALANPRRQVRKVLATRNAADRLAREAPGLPSGIVEIVDARGLDRAAGPGAVHQGIVLAADPLPEVELDEVEDARLLVVLDQVTDPHNVGAILRSAAAFGADALVTTERHGAAESGVLAKAASGGLEHVPIVRVGNLARALAALGEAGVLRLGLDSENAVPIEAVELGGPVALVLGAEGKGLRRLTREHCDHLVRLDMPGAIRSLNVSNAAAVALYAVTRPRENRADATKPPSHA
ncbi:23S rRNA (guanosine(2251)-2'-O)-methyltransferase RlmB [Faunimonas sp. B44]|uniref:23S rRNA (guanosine(2251)-2'-O)-methyltransferase RlmB n=1 Tax=Faunimonas sp. B44 TaxID=3461493 RepID=UPI004044EA33